MSLVIVEMGQADGVTPGGHPLPVLSYHGSVRESIADATASTVGVNEAPGVGRSAIAVITSAEDAHWIAFGPEPVVFGTGINLFVPEGKTRVARINPGDMVAALVHDDGMLPIPSAVYEWDDGTPYEWDDGTYYEWDE